MNTDVIRELIEATVDAVRAAPDWRLVTAKSRLVQAIPLALEAELPAIGSREPTGGSAWLTLDLWVQSSSGGLGMFWRSNPVTDLSVRNEVLTSLLRDPESTGLTYQGGGDRWTAVEDPAFSGATISDRWWPHGDAPNTSAARADVQARLRDLASKVAAMVEVLRGPTGPRRAALAARSFVVGDQYTREQIQRLLGLEPVTGGNWFTGYHQHNGEWFLFPTVGAAGRTGHDYQNRWEDGRLVWFGKTGSHTGQATIRSMTDATASVHLFTRETDRGPFTYEGRARAAEVVAEVPVRVVWAIVPAPDVLPALPEEVAEPETYWEGAVRRVTVNAYERDPAARRACLEHWGTSCSACGLSMGERYGPLAEGYIHVHHLRPIASVGSTYQVDPVQDLRPVCPNCHAVIHLQSPPLAIESLGTLLRGS